MYADQPRTFSFQLLRVIHSRADQFREASYNNTTVRSGERIEKQK